MMGDDDDINDNHEVDMRPPLGLILDGYQRQNYKPETALAEFVDNSVASYTEHKQELEKIDGNDSQLNIVVSYSPSQHVITITDNAYGMNYERFENALKIANRPTIQGGRNEYGMGLKTAASWFGKKWTVTTIAPDGQCQYKAIVDINELIETKANKVKINRDTGPDAVDLKGHGTMIILEELTRKRITSNSIHNLQVNLASTYRRDLKNNKIKITIMGEKLKFEEPTPLTEIIDGDTIVWKKPFDETFEHYGKTYHITGFIAIRERGDYDKTGFALFRRGRVVIGGPGRNYKPKEIFGTSNSPQSLRLYGEVDMDDFPVTQSKDDFDWSMDGLEDAFISKMKEIGQDYIKKTKEYRVPKNKQQNDELVDYFADQINSNMNGDSSEAESNINEIHEDIEEEHINEEIKQNSQEEHKFPNIQTHNVNIEAFKTQYCFKVDYVTNIPNPNADIVTLNDVDGYTALEINLNFPIFEKLNYDLDAIKNIERYLILLIICEKHAKSLSHKDGLIYSFDIRNYLSKLLSDVSKKEDDFNELFGK